jgi:phage terminase small subunit
VLSLYAIIREAYKPRHLFASSSLQCRRGYCTVTCSPNTKIPHDLWKPRGGVQCCARMSKSARYDSDGLTLRESLFVRHYVSNGGNGAQAATAAGYKRQGNVQACALLKLPKIKRIIDRERKRILTELDATSERTLRELARIAYADPRKLFTPDGENLRPVPQLPEDIARAISSLDFRRTQKKGLVSRVRFWSKPAALELIGSYLNMWKGRGDSSETDRLDEIVEAITNSPIARKHKDTEDK